MKIAVLCQEEPVFLGPFIREVLKLRPHQVAAVFLAGRRSGGERKGPTGRFMESTRIYWRIMEPAGFLRALFLRARARLLGTRDPRSIEGTARGLGIAVHRVGDPNGPDFQSLLREVGPDLVLNQSELFLREKVLAIPRRGFINRHASLLPLFRGRLASFRSHAADPPRYGLTIHVVDGGIDTGPIILQREFHHIDPRHPYPRIMDELMRDAPILLWEAVDLMAGDAFQPLSQGEGGKAFQFPSLVEGQGYTELMSRRREHRG